MRFIWKLVMPVEIRQWLESPRAMKTPSSADMSVTSFGDGRVRLAVRHDMVEGVTPEMLEWWFVHFANFGLIQENGEIHSAYRLWHPGDHIQVDVRRHSLSGIMGFSKGASVRLQEVWGGKERRLNARVKHMDSTGISLEFYRGPFRIARLDESFTRVLGGTRYESILVAGDHLRSHWLDSNSLQSWARHSVEETGNLEKFLPFLFARGAESERIPRASVSSEKRSDAANSMRRTSSS